MIVMEACTGKMLLWVSSNLLNWSIEKELPGELFLNADGYKAKPSWYGAPKFFYDNTKEQYFITWHMPVQGITKDDFVGYWCSMRTIVSVTKDFLPCIFRLQKNYSISTWVLSMLLSEKKVMICITLF
jgi:hypothetical protein